MNRKITTYRNEINHELVTRGMRPVDGSETINGEDILIYGFKMGINAWTVAMTIIRTRN